MSENAVGCGAESKLVAGDFAHGQDVEDGSIQKQVNSHDREYAAKNGTRNMARRIFDFGAKIDDTVPTVHGVNDSLQGKQKRHKKRPSEMERGLRHRCAGCRLP